MKHYPWGEGFADWINWMRVNGADFIGSMKTNDAFKLYGISVDIVNLAGESHEALLRVRKASEGDQLPKEAKGESQQNSSDNA